MSTLSLDAALFDELLYISEQDSLVNKTAWNHQDYVASFNNPRHSIMLLKNANAIVGVITYSIIDTEAEILQLFVVSDYQAQGYGSILMQMFFDKICVPNNIQQVLLEVREDNLIAKNLYDKLGFIEAYTRKNYYKCGNSFINAQIMLKTI